jgi:hypothetical protein
LALLHKAEYDGKIQGIKICRGAPSINHLFFADDSSILMKARVKDLKELKHILEVYERASGQVINKDKSLIIFSLNTRNYVRGQVKATISIQSEVRSGNYLGLPISVGKSKKKTFEYFKKENMESNSGMARKTSHKGRKGDSNKSCGSINSHLCYVLRLGDCFLILILYVVEF